MSMCINSKTRTQYKSSMAKYRIENNHSIDISHIKLVEELNDSIQIEIIEAIHIRKKQTQAFDEQRYVEHSIFFNKYFLTSLKCEQIGHKT